jgi:glucokinase
MTETRVVAVDLGGTKVASAIVDASGNLSHRSKRPVNRENVESSVGQIADAIREAIAAAPDRKSIRAAGLIVPGIYFPSTGKAWLPNLWGHDQVSLRAELQQRIDVPLVIDSDRAGYVVGEQWMGAARGLNDVVFLSIGTGIGAGIVAGGNLLRGSGDIAGAVGWFALTPERQSLYVQAGCFEAEAAGPALARRACMDSAEAVIAAARAGDPNANLAVEQTARYLAMGIANIVSILNPEMIVLGGGLMQASDLFLATIKQTVGDWAQPIAARQVRIEITSLGEDAGLLGAARLALASTAA